MRCKSKLAILSFHRTGRKTAGNYKSGKMPEEGIDTD